MTEATKRTDKGPFTVRVKFNDGSIARDRTAHSKAEAKRLRLSALGNPVIRAGMGVVHVLDSAGAEVAW